MQEITKRRGPLWFAIAVLALVTTFAASLAMYEGGRSRADTVYRVGDTGEPNRVDIDVWVGKLDPAMQTATVEVLAQPRGALADRSGFFAADSVLYTSGLKADPIKIKAGEPISALELKVAMAGTFTDYPFDSYRTTLAFDVLQGDRHLPLTASVSSGDTFFTLEEAPAADGVDLAVHAKRSSPAVFFALFIMVLMLGLAVAAAIASFYVLRWRRGLMWPACSMMCALLFALVPLRNAVPGGPPIGSIIDFTSFFIAEGVISVALVASVLIGYRVEIAKERAQLREEAPVGQSPIREPELLGSAAGHSRSVFEPGIPGAPTAPWERREH
ncbi:MULTISPECIES: DUF4436 family protein [unclassified Nocardia]|uniref:DUF4436 family protein n=1 Tax=unclassified Nocardia TaxID=2637762 RepID=UPI001CE3D94F|nr:MULTISPECIES: DUF4436 family protein [unclassified Nocardia]